MKKASLAGIALVALLSVSWWFVHRPMHEEAIQWRLQSEPRPTLILSLDDPAAVLYGTSERSKEIQILREPPMLKPTPTGALLDTLSRFAITVDDKHHPIVHYDFSEKRPAAKAAGYSDSKN